MEQDVETGCPKLAIVRYWGEGVKVNSDINGLKAKETGP